MKAIFRDYQELTIDFQTSIDRGNVWVGMGLGKTLSTGTSITHMQMVYARPALIIAPLLVARTSWPDEFDKWDHLKTQPYSIICGTPAQREAALKVDAAFYFINIENVPWLLAFLGRKSRMFDIIVVDESTRLRGMRSTGGTKRAAAIRKLTERCLRYYNLTGTPTPKGLIDLWGPQYPIDRGNRLGKTYGAFKQRWFYPEKRNYGVIWQPCPGAQDAILDRIAPTTINIRTEDYFPVGQPIFVQKEVELPEGLRKKYRKFERSYFTTVRETDIWARSAIEKRTKLRQMLNGFVYLKGKPTLNIHTVKLQMLASIIEETAGAPILCSYAFKEDVQMLLNFFPFAVHLNRTNIERVKKDWNAGKIRLLIAHPKSCGHGLNLQYGGHHLAFYSMNEDTELHDQIIERIGPARQKQAGFNRAVYIYYILVKASLDGDIFQCVHLKRSNQDVLLEAMNRRGG